MARGMSQKVAVSVVFVAAMFMSIMDATIVNVALPTIGRTFHVPATSVDTVAIYFLVSLAVFIPASGWLGDRFGAKRVLLTAIVVFTAASALCGVAGSVHELELFRVLQGAGGGMLAPVGMAMLYRTFPPQERIRASAILTVPTTFAPALGPVVGGLLTTYVSWRWVFYVNVPIGLAALLFGLAFLEADVAELPGPFDVPGFVLSGAGLGLVMYGISEGPIVGWLHLGVLATICVGVAILAAAAVVELRRANPVIDLRQLSNRLFGVSNIVMILGASAFFGTLYIVSLFFQDGRGLSPLGSGLSTFPEAFGIMFGAQLSSKVLYRVFGPRKNMVLGAAGVAVAIGCMALVGAGTSLWWMRLLMFAMGFAMAQVFVPVNATAFATISPAATAKASTTFNAVRQLGGAVGVAIFTSAVVAVGALTRAGTHYVPNLTAYHVAFVVAAGMSLAAAGAAHRINDADAAATIPKRRPSPVGEQSEQPVVSPEVVSSG